jgi:hypothetical protein
MTKVSDKYGTASARKVGIMMTFLRVKRRVMRDEYDVTDTPVL